MRSKVLSLVVLSVIMRIHVRPAMAQRIDSIHVFKAIPEGSYTSASANTLAWRLHKQHAPFTSLVGDDLSSVAETLVDYRPSRHAQGPITELGYLAMVFSGGRPLPFGISDDLDLVINFTAHTEYRISTWAEHLRVRALLAKLLVEHGVQ